MAVPWPFGRWWVDELRRGWDDLFSLSSAAVGSIGLPVRGTLPGDPFGAIVGVLRARVVGKNRTFRVNGRDLTLILDDISVEGNDLARSMGQYGEVRITARDIEWDGGRLERMEIQARNVHLRPAVLPTLVAAPVRWEVFVAAASASSWWANAASRFDLGFSTGVPHIGLAGRRSWVRLELEVAAAGRSIRVRPRALRLGNWRLPLLLPVRHVWLHSLPSDIVLTEIESDSAGVMLRGQLSEWRRSLSLADVERFVAALLAETARIDI